MSNLVANFIICFPKGSDSSQHEYKAKLDNAKQTPQVLKVKPVLG
jgi:hypothetical protein